MPAATSSFILGRSICCAARQLASNPCCCRREYAFRSAARSWRSPQRRAAQMVEPGPATPRPPELALSIVIPVYNGAASVGELVGALEPLSIAGGHEIILVNDGSPDNSLEVCTCLLGKARVPITLVSLARNYGEHNAVMTGL